MAHKVQKRNSRALAMELRLSCTNPSTWFLQIQGSQSSLVVTNSSVFVPLPVSCIPFYTFPIELGSTEMFKACTSFVLKNFGCLLPSVKCHTDKHICFTKGHSYQAVNNYVKDLICDDFMTWTYDFCITDPLWGESTGHRCSQRANNIEL